MSRTISTGDLVQLGACATAMRTFRRIFDEADDGVEVTVENALAAGEALLSLGWLARIAFTTPALTAYNTAWNLADDEHQRTSNAAWKEFWVVSDAMPDREDPSLDQARRKRAQSLRASRAAFKLALATAWVEAYEASAEVAGKGDE